MIIRFYDYEPTMVVAMLTNISPLCKDAKKKGITFEFINCNINNHNKSNTMYVIPANSFVTMGGGLDGILDDMFRIKEKAYEKVMTYGVDNRNNIGKKYLPVGESVVTEISKERHQYLLSCPTMYYPSSIKETHNVLNATIAALSLAEKLMKKDPTLKYLYLPGMGTGVGGMDYSDSAKQMAKAVQIYLDEERYIKEDPWDYFSPEKITSLAHQKKPITKEIIK